MKRQMAGSATATHRATHTALLASAFRLESARRSFSRSAFELGALGLSRVLSYPAKGTFR